MLKVLIFIILMTGSASGYLCYDWYEKRNPDQEKKYTYLYSWIDKQGQAVFSDKKPPTNAQNIKIIEAPIQAEEPLVILIQEHFSGFINDSRIRFTAMKNSILNTTEIRSTQSQDTIKRQDPPITAFKKKKYVIKKRGKT